MIRQDPFSQLDEETINRTTSVEAIVSALAKRGCADLASSIDLSACSDHPWAGGGYCDVYRGKLIDGTIIAIKSLRVYDGPDGAIQGTKILKRAARELYYWSKLQHPNVLRLLGLTLFRGSIALVSEWMDNKDLLSFVRQNPDADRIALCINICDGLSYIHAQEMVHGDLKSAPECMESKPPTKEADVYACGMTMLEALTGNIPFHTKSETQVMYLVLQGRHPPRPEVDIADPIWGLVDSCWNSNPTERPSIKHVSDCLHGLCPDYKRWAPEACPGSPPVPNSQEGANQLLILVKALMERSGELGESAVVDAAINYCSQALQLTPDNDINKPDRLYWLGGFYGHRFERRGELSDLDQAINYYSQAVQFAPKNSTNRPNRLYWLGVSHYRRFECCGEILDLNQTIVYHSQAVHLMPDSDTDKPDLLHWLGQLHCWRFDLHSKLSDIDEAIIYLTRAVQLTPENDANAPDRLCSLGVSYFRIFERRHWSVAINQAISYHRRAVRLTSDYDENKPDRLSWLGRSYYLRFKSFGDLSDIYQAISYQNQAVRLTPDGTAAKANRLHLLNDADDAYRCRLEHLEELPVTREAVPSKLAPIGWLWALGPRELRFGKLDMPFLRKERRKRQANLWFVVLEHSANVLST